MMKLTDIKILSIENVNPEYSDSVYIALPQTSTFIKVGDTYKGKCAMAIVENCDNTEFCRSAQTDEVNDSRIPKEYRKNYYQPLYKGTIRVQRKDAEESKDEIFYFYDTSCGSYGGRFEAVLGEETARWGSMIGNDVYVPEWALNLKSMIDIEMF